ncbi:UNVERIFIED_CONTAM: hypothetical protein FKN15_071391 [Acipenser sinensis]
MADPLICWVLDVGFEKYPVVSMTNHGLMPVRKLMQGQRLEHVGTVPMKKWYEIEFSPTTFHKRSFKTEGIGTPIQTESSTQGPLTGDRADVIWETQSQVYIENTTKSCAYVTRHQKTAPPCIHVTIEDLKVQSGEEAKFEAVIEGNPTPEITWYKCGVLLSASDRVYLSQKDAECSLTLLTVSSQDRGIYTCVAKNISGEVSCKAELSVYEEGCQFLSSSRILLSAIPKECHTLTILSAEEEDLGSYRCVATNPGGEASTSCTLIVSELPTCLTVPEVTQVDGDGALLVWKPLESSEPVTYSIQYSTEGGEWRTLAEGVVESCYTASKLSVGAVYSFRVACVNKAGMGPYSEQSAETTIGEEHEEWHIPLIRTIPPRAEGEDSKPESRFPLFPMHETYTFLSEINRGRFSIIKQCRGDLTQKLFAAKVTPYKADKRHLVLREYQILKRLRHTHVVQLQAAFITLKYLVLIEELCAGQELLHNLAERLSGDWPFASDVDCEKEKNIKRGKIKFGRCYSGVSEGAMNFVKCSLNNKPWGRPSASDCVVLPWLCGDHASKQRHSVVSFPTAKLHGYLREREKRRAHHCTKLELPIQGHFSMGNGQSITLLDGLM